MRWHWYRSLLRQQQHLQAHLSSCNINLNCMQRLRMYSNDTKEENLCIWYQNGLPVIEIPLPSRREMCQFTLKPITDTVARFCRNIEYEDKGIEIVYVYSTTGNRIAGNTLVQHLLLRGNFRLRINDYLYVVKVPPTKDTTATIKADISAVQKFDDLKLAVASLYSIMNVDEYKTFQEKMLVEKYENVKAELKPLIQTKFEIDTFCRKRAERKMWLTLAAIGFQAGFLARLTWWELGWNIVEPITYFATSTMFIASFSYYLYTNEYYSHSNHKRRSMNLYFHKKATKSNFDISRFNELQHIANSLKHDLKRLRDPLYQHFPATGLASFRRENNKMQPTTSKKRLS